MQTNTAAADQAEADLAAYDAAMELLCLGWTIERTALALDRSPEWMRSVLDRAELDGAPLN